MELLSRLSKWDKEGLELIVRRRARRATEPRHDVFAEGYPLLDAETGKELNRDDLSVEAVRVDLSNPDTVRKILGVKRRHG